MVGTGRCGSTLLQTMLMAHPEIRMPPETQFFEWMDPAAFGLRDPLPDGSVEEYLGRVRAGYGWTILNAGEPPLGEAYEDAVRGGLRSARDQFWWVADRLAEEPTGSLRGEKTPQHWMHMERLLVLFPDARVIHICRDPRDVVVGLMGMDWWRGRSIRRTARHWRKALLAAHDWQARLGPRRHRIVRYEDLVADPRGVLEGLAAFLGVAFDPAMLERSGAGGAFQAHEAGYKGRAAGPVTASRLGRYRAVLSPFQIRVVEAAAGTGLMVRLGYQPDPEVARPAWAVLDPALARVAEVLRLPAGTRPRG